MRTTEPDRRTGVAALETRELTLRIDGAVLVQDVSLSVEPGELLAVIGPNGAGKTSLFDLITGIRRPTSGTVTLAGREITRLGVSRRSRLGLGRTFQTSSVFPALPVAENVRLAARAHAGGVLRRPGRDAGLDEVVSHALDRVRLAERRSVPAGTLPHGDKRKLELALVLVQQPDVVLLDEPMAGMSAEEVPGLAELIGGLRADGRTVLLVEHHMNVVLGLADRIAVLHHGRLLAVDEPDRIMSDATVQSAYLGEPL